MNMMNKCAKFHKDSPSDKKVKFNLPSVIELSKTANLMQASNFGGTFGQLFLCIFYEIFTEDASLLFLYHGAKKSKMTKSWSQRGVLLRGVWREHCFPAPFSWFLHETGLESLKIYFNTSARCFSLKCQRKTSKKSKRTPPVFWRPWALAYSRNRSYNFSCLSAMSKNSHLRSFSSALGCHLARKSLLWPAMPVSNKKQEFEQRKRRELFDDFWVHAYRFNFAIRRRSRARSM